jgi:DNA-binding transcriptional MerR regulator
MGRPRIDVDIAKLQDTIDELENARIAAGNPFRSRFELHEAIANTEWARSLGLSVAVIYLRIRDHGLECQTPAYSVRRSGRKSRLSSAVSQFNTKEFLQVFLDQGIEIEGIHSIITNAGFDKETNTKIQGAWKILRERYSSPSLLRAEMDRQAAEKTQQASATRGDDSPLDDDSDEDDDLPLDEDGDESDDRPREDHGDEDDETGDFSELTPEEFNARQAAYDSRDYEVQETDSSVAI